jgi:glycosyltransferase A (GT-A) superfamily protein (DUF2064 family)
MKAHVLVMAKAPVAGRVKTRLCPPLAPGEAASVASAALADTLDAVAACGAGRRLIALDGEPGPWLPAGFEVFPQRGHSFAERLANAWADSGGWGIQIGMDTPQVGPPELDALLAALDRPGRPAVLGHAADGGWWVIGFGWPAFGRPRWDDIFDGVPMSTPFTGTCQESRLRVLGFDVMAAPVRRDIDTVDDLAAVAASIPTSRTASVARQLGLIERVA